ncbi:Multicopper oxidase [Phytophthora infestans]|uniref:Multicopper oxidase n=2 Tax=Phytophthora infestans TaxID=4787 RepID=A0A8S9UCZ7_PHYIN|nr:Multicopper oxidase [Phytophthora infestans]
MSEESPCPVASLPDTTYAASSSTPATMTPFPLVQTRQLRLRLLCRRRRLRVRDLSSDTADPFSVKTPYPRNLPPAKMCYIPTTHHFGADKDGNFWWHCDHSTQYTYGQRGPLIIHPREDQLQPWEMNVGAEYKVQLAKKGSILINNRGRYNCAAAASHGFKLCPEDQPLTHFRFQAGKSYHLRLLFMRALDQFEFSIDGHQLRAIAPNGESLEPFKLITNITINIGQQIAFSWWRRIPRICPLDGSK